MKRFGFRRAALAIAATAAIAATSIAPAFANPTGGTVVAGRAAIHTAPKRVTVHQRSDRAVIDWQNFSIGTGEVTNFRLPSSTSAVLNRVTSADPSSIYGTLKSNGQVYLLNPNGIFVGPNGQIATGSFIASTLAVDNAAFMGGGPLNFFGGSNAPLVNLGTIEAASGDVGLFAAQVSNAGTISAPNGTAALGSGSNILYAPGNDDDVLIQAPAPPPASGASVDNHGTIAAAVAELKAAGSPYALAVNNAGRISATTVTNVGGRVLLDGGAGQTVDSGTIHADATGNGNGGSVVVKGGDTTMSGTITARGGPQGGNGGSAEISGDTLNFTGDVDLTAPHGATGNLLLDPTDFTIDASTWDAIDTALGAANVDVAATNSITVSSAVTSFNSTALTLDAPTIAIDDTIDVGTGTGNALVLQNTSGTTTGSSLTSASGAEIVSNALDIMGFDTTALNGTVNTGTLAIGGTGFTATSFSAPHVSAGQLVFGQGLPTTTDVGGNVTSVGSVATGTGTNNPAFSGSVTVSEGFNPFTISGQATANAFTLTSGNDLILNPGTVLTATGGETTVGATGASGYGVFVNNAGTGVFAGPGRKIVYSTTDGQNSRTLTNFNDGGLIVAGYPVYYGFTYGTDPAASGNAIYIANSSSSPILTITPNDASWLYGSPDASGITYALTTSNGSTPGSISGLQFNVGGDVNVGTYPIDPSGALIAGYRVEYGTGTLTVTAAPLTIGASSFSKTYGSANPTFTPVISGLVNGDSSSIVSGTTFSTTATTGSGVGTYTISPANATLSSSNYYIQGYANGTLTVNPAPLTITAPNTSMVYGDTPTLPPSAVQYSGFVNGDASAVVSGLQFNTSASPTANVGNYSLVLFGATASNYTIGYGPSLMTVTPAPLYFTVNDATMSQEDASLPSFSASFTGFKNGDGPSIVSGMVFSTTAKAPYTENEPPFGNFLIEPEPGTYPISAVFQNSPAYGPNGGYGIAKNYTVMPSASPNGVLTISPVPPVQLIITKSDTDVQLTNVNVIAPTPSIVITYDPLDLGSPADEIETAAINALTGTGASLNLMSLMSPAASGYTTAVGDLLPFLYQQLTNILDLDPSTWTTAQSDFVTDLENYIDAQRQAAAQQADTEYQEYLQQQNLAWESSLNGTGVAGIYLNAIEAANPTVPPQTFIEQAQAGLVLTNGQVSALGAIQTQATALGQQAEDATVAAGDLMLAYIGSNSTSFNASAIQQELNSGDPTQVQTAIGQLQTDATTLKLTLPSFTDAQISQQITTNYQAAGTTLDYVPGTSAAVGDIASVVGRAVTSVNKSMQALPSVKLFGTFLTQSGDKSAKAAVEVFKTAAGETDTVKTAGAVGEEAGEAGAELAGDVLATAGAVLEVVGTVVQIAVSAAQYVKVDDYTNSFNAAISAANQKVGLSDLQAMAAGTQSTGPNLITYLSAMLDTGGSVGTLTATQVQGQ